MPAQVTPQQIARKLPQADLSQLPTSNPGGGKPWLSGGAVVVGNYAGNSVDWSAIANKPTEFTPTAHTHDDRYYTKSEIDAGYAKLSGGNSFSGNQAVTGNLTLTGNINTGFLAATPEQSNIAGTKLGGTGNGPWVRGTGAAYTISRTNSQTSASLYFYSFSNETVQVFGRLGIGGIIQSPQSFLTAASNTLSLWQSDGTTPGDLAVANVAASSLVSGATLQTANVIRASSLFVWRNTVAGKTSMRNWLETSGVTLDYSTNGVLGVRNIDDTAHGSVYARAGGTRFVNGLQGTHGIEFSEIHSDGRTSLRHSANTGNNIEFYHAGPGNLNYWSLVGCSIMATTKWGTGSSGNSNNLVLYQSSARGADATIGIYSERYADATSNGQPKLAFYGKRISLNTKSADTYLLSGVVEQAYIDTNGLTVNNNINASGYVSSAFRSLSANPTTLDIASGLEQLVKNTTSGELRRWANDGGSMKSILYA